VREWTYPPQLYTSTMMSGRPVGLVNLERAPDSKALWCLLQEYHGALIQFLPGASGLFTRFTTSVPGTPLIYPQDLKFDDNGGLWFIGSTVTNHVTTISRFDPASKTATSWEVPRTAMGAVSIHPDRAGKKVWVSSVDANIPSTTQWIGCLDVASGVLTCFSPQPYRDPPRSIDIVLVENTQPYSVWFTAATSALLTPSPAVPAIYRLDLATNAFHKHVVDPGTSWPRFLAVDPGGVAWSTDIGRGSIVSCTPARDCGTVRFKSSTFRLKSSKVRLLGKECPVRSTVSRTAPQPDSVTVKRHRCAEEYRAAAMQYPDRIQLQLPGTAPDPRLFFVNFGANKIGMLQP
jgi:hypothetical protein